MHLFKIFAFTLMLLCPVINIVAQNRPYDFMEDNIAYRILPNGNHELMVCDTDPYAQIGDEDNDYYISSNNYQGLEHAVIPETVVHNGEHYTVTSIGFYAFASSKIKSVHIPKTITKIGGLAFNNCQSLETVYINDLTAWLSIEFGYYTAHYYSYYCYYDIDEWRKESSANPMTCASQLLLNGQEVTELVVPETINEIKDYAFMGCDHLTRIKLHNGISTIGTSAFAGCTKLNIVEASNLQYWCGVSRKENAFTAPFHLLLNDKELKHLEMPYSMTEIKPRAFEYCGYITDVNIPESVSTIGANAFYGCKSLASLSLPSTISRIDNGAFVGCNNLLEIHSQVKNPASAVLGDQDIWWKIQIYNYDNPPADSMYCSFSRRTKLNGILYVPSKTKHLLEDCYEWNSFKNVVETSVPSGDLSGDGIVDVSDVDKMIDMVLGKVEQDITVADLNGDGKVDVSDVNMLIDMVLGKGSGSEGNSVTQTYTVNGISFKMVEIKGGTFQMGGTSEQQWVNDNETPVHQVTVSDYCLGQTEVTQELWKAVMGYNPSKFRAANGYEEDLQRPVEMVTREDALTFISRLNELTGENFRLPTEAEWEYAARGGDKSCGTMYAGGNDPDPVAWCAINSGKITHAVGTKLSNELGLYDMSGNVYEWCSDFFGDYSSTAQVNPTGPTAGDKVVVRGASWYHAMKECRVSARMAIDPTRCYDSVGIRLVK